MIKYPKFNLKSNLPIGTFGGLEVQSVGGKTEENDNWHQ